MYTQAQRPRIGLHTVAHQGFREDWGQQEGFLQCLVTVGLVTGAGRASGL